MVPYSIKTMTVLFVFVLLMSTARSSGTSNELSERMSYFLTKLCPGSNICKGNVSSNVDNDYTCCTDCSCAPDCGITGNCCFANKNQTLGKITNDTSRRTEDVKRQCLYPVAGESEPSDINNFLSYNMISLVVWNDAYDKSKACGNSTVAPWGSLFPVFSKQANAIYKNELCAKLDNITDGVFWEATLQCEVYKPENLQAHLERGLLPKDCRVHFKYPGDFKDIEPQLCFIDMIDFCTTTKFNVPVSINATKDDIIEACQGGLLSPYHGDRYSLYSNVFCHICSGSQFRENTLCSDKKKPSGPSGGIFGLLSIDSFNPQPEAQKTLNLEISTVCPANVEQKAFDCRPVFCPSGRMRNGRGSCAFPIKQWYQQDSKVYIELISEQGIDITKTFGLEKGGYSEQIESLLLPNSLKLKYWAVLGAFFKVNNFNNEANEASTNCLILEMSRNFGSAFPTNVITKIDLLISTNWTLKNLKTNETFLFKPTLFDMDYPSLEPSSSHFKENETLTIQRPMYKRFYIQFTSLQKTFILITKLHFCEQVELEKGEYYLSEDRAVLYNKIGQQYLFNGEFALLSGAFEETVRICVEGSGFKKNNSTNCAAVASIAYSVVVYVVFLALKVLLASLHAV